MEHTFRKITDSDTATYCLILTTRLGLYANFRVDSESLPKRWHCYDVEAENGVPKNISNSPVPDENWYGCVLTEAPLTFFNSNAIEIKSDDDFELLWDEVNILKYFSMPFPERMLDYKLLNEYGYHWDGMIGLTYNDALYYYEKGLPIYTLFDNDTEVFGIETKTDIKACEENQLSARLFGIEKPDWYKYLYVHDENKSGDEICST